MSLYRFLRTSALLAMAGKYRAKLYRVAIALILAIVSAWLYGDVSVYLQNQQPDLLGPALLVKTVIVFGALAYVFWQLRPGAWGNESSNTGANKNNTGTADSIATSTAANPTEQSGPLDELLDKPSLKSRRESILGDSPPKD